MTLERGRPRGLIQTSYELDSQKISGVVSVIKGMEAALKEEFHINLVGPHIKDKSRNEADFTLGKVVRIYTALADIATRGDTKLKPGISFNKSRARNLMLTTQPDFVILEEPLSTPAAHTLISGTPKRGDGQPLPIFIGHFHAQKENIGLALKIIKNGLKLMRRPAFGKNYVHKFGIIMPWTQGMINTVLNSLDGKVAVSKSTADGWMKQFPQIGEMEVIYNPVDTENFTPNGPKIESWNDGKATILFTGRHDTRKGISYLIQAYDSLRKNGIDDIKLKIAGYGDEITEELKALVMGLRTPDVEFLGILPKDDPTAMVDLVRAKRSADIFASTATGGEGFGLDPAEAAASGTLTIASDINGYREVFGGRDYARMPVPKDVPAIAKSIIELKSLPEETRTRLEHMAREDIHGRFNKGVIGGQWVKYIGNLMDQRGRPTKDSWPVKKRKRKSALPVSDDIFRG